MGKLAADHYPFAAAQTPAPFTGHRLAFNRLRMVMATCFLVGHRQQTLACRHRWQNRLPLFGGTQLLKQAGSIDLGMQVRLKTQAPAELLHHQHVFHACAAEAFVLGSDWHRGNAQL